MVLIDLLYAYRLRRKQPISWWIAPLASAAGMLIVLPLMNGFFLYPKVTWGNLPMMLIAPALAAILGSGLGQTVGDYLAMGDKQLVPLEQNEFRSITWATAALLLLTVAFVAWFVATAQPPTA
jgi:hypothetical protein